MRSAIAIAVMACILALAPGRTGIAQGACAEPPVPAPVDGAQLSEQQMRAAADAARNFIAQSDVYQACLASALDAAKTQASAGGKALDPGLETGLRAKADANQKVKEKVGVEINTAIGVYKQTHLK
ncbi:MAG TPA: hypothetical protein VMO78_14905 [Rhizomicrobium sp.]|nr:hypothetical protein [Rhizomicrobium sp.]